MAQGMLLSIGAPPVKRILKGGIFVINLRCAHIARANGMCRHEIF